MAVEIGLHCTPEASDASGGAKDERNRVFWTIYAIEITLAYNLGRPPSIGEDHIISGLPQPTNGNSTSLHYVRHRQLQSRIVAQIYGSNSSARNMPVEKRELLILDLQKSLDEWQANIPVESRDDGPYPYRFVLTISLKIHYIRANSAKATGIASTMEQRLSCIDKVHSAHVPLFSLWSDVLDPPEAISTTSLIFFASATYPCLGCWFKASYLPA